MRKNYASYTAIDFARDLEFLKWVKYPAQNEELCRFWLNWLSENPSKREEVEEARQLIFAVLEEQYVPTDQKQSEIWSRIKQTLHENEAFLKSEESEFADEEDYGSRRRWIAVAASVALIIVCSLGYYVLQTSDRADGSLTASEFVLKREENKSSSPRTVVLEDGTSVILQPNSIINFPETFNVHEREVYLTGEAFFEVKKDATRPFKVHADEIVTRVLGTSFSVRNFKNGNVEVKVKTGKVSVFKDPGNDQDNDDKTHGVVLTPNQQVVYDRDQMRLTKSLVENPVVLIPKTKYDFEFRDTPVKEVFKEIEDAYGVDIVYDEDVLSNCYLNASLSDVPLYEKLRLICKGINASYEMMDSHIIIYGEGCD